MLYTFVVIPLISALIGWVTNVVAIKLLFWPQQPIGLAVFKLQGVLPKRRSEIAASIGQLVEEQLLSWDDVVDQVNAPQVREKFVATITEIMRDKLNAMLPRFVPPKVVQLIADTLEKIFRQEADQMIHQVVESGRDYLSSEVQIKKLVEDKINDFDLEQIEAMVRGVASTELRFIEILGGVLGFIIGLVQAALLLIMPG